MSIKKDVINKFSTIAVALATFGVFGPDASKNNQPKLKVPENYKKDKNNETNFSQIPVRFASR